MDGPWTSSSYGEQSSEWASGTFRWFSPGEEGKGKSNEEIREGIRKSEDTESPNGDAIHLSNGMARDALSFSNDSRELLLMDKSFFMEMYKHSTWNGHCMLVICKTLQYHQNYEINRSFPDFLDGGYGSRSKDTLGLDNFSILFSRSFGSCCAYVTDIL